MCHWYTNVIPYVLSVYKSGDAQHTGRTRDTGHHIHGLPSKLMFSLSFAKYMSYLSLLMFFPIKTQFWCVLWFVLSCYFFMLFCYCFYQALVPLWFFYISPTNTYFPWFFANRKCWDDAWWDTKWLPGSKTLAANRIQGFKGHQLSLWITSKRIKEKKSNK